MFPSDLRHVHSSLCQQRRRCFIHGLVASCIFLQANFPSLDALIARIKQDGKLAEAALEEAPFATFRKDSYLTSLLESST